MAWVQNQLYVKRRNTLMLLDLIAQKQTVSRTQLAELTELSPASITRIVNSLMNLQLVREEGVAGQTSRGRKARLLHTCADGLYAVGVYIEQNRLLISLNDFHHHCLYCDEAPLTPDDARNPAAMAALARTLLDRADRACIPDWSRVRVAGISVPGVVDSPRGVALKSDQLGWLEQDVRTPFEAALGLPVWLENDAKACLVGEQARMNLPRQEDAVYLLVGGGVGIAVMSNGKLVRGHRNMAGEVEHLNLIPGLQTVDVLQSHLIEQSVLQSAQTASPSVRTLDDLMIAYRQNAGFARILVEDILQYLRLVLSMVDCFYDPKRIILGGVMIQKLREALVPLFADPRVSEGGDYETSCMVGASIGAFDQAVSALLGETDTVRS
ncbi:MAG: ROK family transcriptional regulator [Candidatus Limiplasma sp.]|nr:ROK family transcriptional regulator [Candidatus Limiplasma sp.]